MDVKELFYVRENLSVAKVAMVLAMAEDVYDRELIKMLEEMGIKAITTRAGGMGDNVRNKIVRNALVAAENGNIIAESDANRSIFIRCIEDAMKMFEGPIAMILGTGIKIGIARRGQHLAVALYGNVGIPGIGGDKEVCGVGVNYFGLVEG